VKIDRKYCQKIFSGGIALTSHMIYVITRL
jgi:hypothetical protein